MMTAYGKAGNLLTAAGLIMIASAAGLVMYNVSASGQAGSASQKAVDSFIAHLGEISSENTDSEERNPGYAVYQEYYNENHAYADASGEAGAAEEVYFEENGVRLLAVLALPSIGTEIPVSSDFSMELMKNYPCRYSGTVAGDDIVIAAHNYDSHFGRLKNILSGDEVTLTDAAGNRIVYTVSETEMLPGDAVSEMKSGEWDLTLFTCDLSGRSRITVRCIRK